MVWSRKLFWASASLAVGVSFSKHHSSGNPYKDYCAAIANKKWVAPSDLRACFLSFPLDPVFKQNVIDATTMTLAFHTSVNYQLKAPPPYDHVVREDILGDLARIKDKYHKSDYELYFDVFRAFDRLNDGHCFWVNQCYDSAYFNVLPTPLVLLTDADGVQNVHIAPEAFDVASAEFPDEIDFWQHETGGELESLSGAKVLLINGDIPFKAVKANADIGDDGFQANSTRENLFFASYIVDGKGTWTYNMGDFALQRLPLSDTVTLRVQKIGKKRHEDITVLTLSYRSRITSNTVKFDNATTYWNNNCLARSFTNGVDITSTSAGRSTFTSSPRRHALGITFDSSRTTDISLPHTLTPPQQPIPGSQNFSQFYVLEEGKTGVLALSRFSDRDFDELSRTLLQGLQSLRDDHKVTQLIVDVTNNPGGFVCIAHWLHRIIVGPTSTTEPNAGLPVEARAAPLALKISHAMATNSSIDPDARLFYNPVQWTDENNKRFSPTDDWLLPINKKIINGRQDAFSPRKAHTTHPLFKFDLYLATSRLGTLCLEAFALDPPDTPLFDPAKVVVVSNGACASACALFTTVMAKVEGSKTVVFGGRQEIPQQYAGTFSGVSMTFTDIDTEIKSAGFKNDSLAPPDLLSNSFMGFSWMLAFGVNNPNEPEEWQDRTADHTLPLTTATVNNPAAIWKEVAHRFLE